jgi:hypothetical protein
MTSTAQYSRLVLPAPSVASATAESSVERGTLPIQKLRIGLFLDSPLQPLWAVQAIAAASNTAEVVVIAQGALSAETVPKLWRLYDRLDRRLFCPGPDLLASVELKQRVPHHHLMELPNGGEAGGTLSLWRAGLMDLRLDIAIALGEIDTRWLEGLARHGIWRYAFGDWHQPLDHLAGWREVLEGKPVTAAALIVRRRAGDERIAYQSWSRTCQLSVARNRQQLLRKLMHFTGRAMEQVRLDGETWLDQCDKVEPPSALAPRAPDTAFTLRTAGAVGLRLARRAAQKALSVDQWFLAYRFSKQDSWDGSLEGFRCLVPPRDRFWADPFPIEHAGRYFIFFEELLFATGKGHISVVEVSRAGECSPSKKVLERDYHLSYPFLLELQGELFMVPESLQNRTVDLYRCIQFPDQWKLERRLLGDTMCADATFHHQDGRWWMFVNVGIEGAEVYDELHLYCAERFEGPWRAHKSNPVKCDVRGARPAGRLFFRDGKLYRPAQICAPLYGSGLAIHEVLELSRQAYIEREDRRILPVPQERLLGLHTLNRAGDLRVVDAFMRRARFGGAGKPA